MSEHSHKLFVNLAARNLKRSVEFFTKLGFAFDPRFTDETVFWMDPEAVGWPMILSGLKTLLETGQSLATPGSLRYAGTEGGA